MRTRSILSNTSFNILGLAFSTLIALVLMPFLVTRLGSELFGVWALFGVVITASQLLDFGLGRALVRHTAQYRSLGRSSLISRELNSLLWPLLAALFSLALLGWLLAPWLAGLLGVPEHFLAEATPALRLMVLGFIPVGLALLMGAMLEGAQQMQYTSGALALNRLLFAIGAVVAIGLGWGLPGVAAAYLLAASIQALVLALASARVTPSLRFSIRLMRPHILVKDLRFGLMVTISGLVALGFVATNKLALARGVGIDSVAYFELATLVALQIFALAMAGSRALYPALAAAQARGGLKALAALYARAVRLMVMALLPLVALLIVLARPLVEAWLGSAPNELVLGMQWLLGAWTIAAIASIASAGLLALGRAGWAAAFPAYNALANLVLVLLLLPVLGYWGVIAANVVAVTTSALLTLAFFARLLGMKSGALLAALSPGILLWVAGLALGFVWLVGQVTRPGWLELVLLGCLYLVVYLLGLLALGLLRPDESAWLKQRFGQRPSIRGQSL